MGSTGMASARSPMAETAVGQRFGECVEAPRGRHHRLCHDGRVHGDELRGFQLRGFERRAVLIHDAQVGEAEVVQGACGGADILRIARAHEDHSEAGARFR
jgi:hypothetical protein